MQTFAICNLLFYVVSSIPVMLTMDKTARGRQKRRYSEVKVRSIQRDVDHDESSLPFPCTFVELAPCVLNSKI